MTLTEKSRIPLLLALSIGLFILFLAWAGKQASTGGTDITDPEYYSKGLKYNSTLVEKRAASVIGWKLSADLQPGKIVLHLSDRKSAPVIAADARIVFLDPGRDFNHAYPFVEKEPGVYSLNLPPELRGEHLTRIEIERAGARINRQLLLSIKNPGIN